MITLKSPREIEIMGRAGRIVAGTLARIREILRPGLSTEDLDAEAERFIRSHDGAVPSFKGLYGFPKTLCTSIDQEIVHGIPSPRRMLDEGSIVSVDVGVQLEGLHADSATTIPVGEIEPETERLLRVTQECLAAGIAEAKLGNHVGDIGHAVQRVAEGAGYSAATSADNSDKSVLVHPAIALLLDGDSPRFEQGALRALQSGDRRAIHLQRVNAVDRRRGRGHAH